jgi:hypothetical protein
MTSGAWSTVTPPLPLALSDSERSVLSAASVMKTRAPSGLTARVCAPYSADGSATTVRASVGVAVVMSMTETVSLLLAT